MFIKKASILYMANKQTLFIHIFQFVWWHPLWLENKEIKIKIEIVQCLGKCFSVFNMVKLNLIKQYFQKMFNLLKLENITEKG